MYGATTMVLREVVRGTEGARLECDKFGMEQGTGSRERKKEGRGGGVRMELPAVKLRYRKEELQYSTSGSGWMSGRELKADRATEGEEAGPGDDERVYLRDKN